MPGSHIPIIDSKLIYKDKIDYLIVFPWNLISEIKNNNNNLAKNGTKFVKIIPDIEIL